MSARRLRTLALDAWRAELRAGTRTKYTFDELWVAACAEAYALEAPSNFAASYVNQARRIIREAARGSAA